MRQKLFLILAYAIVTTSFATLCHCMERGGRNNYIPQDFIEAYNEFSTDIVKDRIFVAHSKAFGASAACTFGIGHVLAVLNERICEVPTTGVDQVLRTLSSAIPYAYEALLDSLTEDSDIHLTSNIYTSNRSLELTKTLKGLDTRVIYQDFSMPQVVVPRINSRIAIQTFSRINDRLIPRGGWYGPSIWSFTKAVFVETFFYKNRFETPFMEAGEEFFMTTKVPTLVTAGNFRMRQTDEFTSVAIPMHDSGKTLVLVLPRRDIKQMMLHVDDAFNMEIIGRKKPVVVQIPKLNFTLSNEYFSQLFLMGMNQSMCNWKDGFKYFLQPVDQALHVYMDAQRFEVASATGVQLNDNKEFHRSYGYEFTPAKEPKDWYGDEYGSFESEFSPRSLEVEDIQDSNYFRKKELLLQKRRQQLNYDYKEQVVFDRPFYWYLKDDVIGPIFSGIVSSFKQYEEQHSAIEQEFDDMFKFQFWNCGNKHLALIDRFEALKKSEEESSSE